MSPKHPIILYVDDDTDDQLFVHEAMKAVCPMAHLVAAENGLGALFYLDQAQQLTALPALIIMDINMPIMNGKEAVIHIRKNKQWASIPIVLFTTSSSPFDKQFCEQHHITFITKPATGRELQNVIENVLTLASINCA
jgi:CheY-like chemotaxis protein